MPRISISSDQLKLKVPSGATGGDVTMSGELVIKGGPAANNEPDPAVLVNVGGTVGVNVSGLPAVQASVTSLPAVSVGVTALPTINAAVTALPTINASVTALPPVNVGMTAPIKVDLGTLGLQPGIKITFYLFGLQFLPLLSMRIRGNASFGS